MVLRRLSIEVAVTGQSPQSGLIVSNHLSYLDILLYSSALPCIFVAKEEVRAWPLLGLLASMGGTVFIDRGRASSAAAAAKHIEQLLAAGIPVLLFPEGTSSDGLNVLRFHPSLFEPAIRTSASTTAAAVAYSAGPAATEKDLCYYGDIGFAPHLLYTLGLPRIQAMVRFSPHAQIDPHRKSAASRTWSEVAALRARLS